MAVKVKTKAKKGIKKRFFDVAVELTAMKVQLYASGIDELEGKVVKLDLSRSLRGKNLEVKLRVKKRGENLEGNAFSLELAGSYIRRMMRKGTDYVEDSFEVDVKDGRVVVKPFMITRKKVSRAVRRALREAGRKYLENYLKMRDSKELFDEIMTGKLQKELSLKLKKVYPLALCEIRRFEVLGGESAGGEKEEVVKEEKKSEKEEISTGVESKEKEEKKSEKEEKKSEKEEKKSEKEEKKSEKEEKKSEKEEDVKEKEKVKKEDSKEEKSADVDSKKSEKK